MVRNESQLKDELGEPSSRYDIPGEHEIFRWKCSCLAVRIDGRTVRWSPCELHRPPDWIGHRDE